MDGLIPRDEREDAIRPHYPKTLSGRGRRLYPLPAMLRVHCVQLFHNLSGPGMPGMGDMLYEVEPVRGAEAGGAAGRDDDPEVPAPAGEARARGRS